ncbi:MAG: DUF4198 domain-containing protein [Granulosicoccus sp.]
MSNQTRYCKSMNRYRLNLIAGFICLLGSAIAQAHDFWIEPSTFVPEEDQAIDVSLHFGEKFKGDTLPYINALFNDFSVTDQHGRIDIKSVQGNDPAATITTTVGAQLLGYQSNPQFVTVDAEKFNKYIEEEGIEYIREVRERRGESNSPAPENFSRCAKALIQSGPAEQEVYRQKLGYTLELIPQKDPYTLKKGDALEFVLLYEGKPIDGLQVQALSKATPDSVQKVRTDANGKARIIVDENGPWLVKVVLILPVPEKQRISNGIRDAVWESFWASYVFELVEG